MIYSLVVLLGNDGFFCFGCALMYLAMGCFVSGWFLFLSLCLDILGDNKVLGIHIYLCLTYAWQILLGSCIDVPLNLYGWLLL